MEIAIAHRDFRLPFFPAKLLLEIAGPEETRNQRGNSPPPDSDPFSDVQFGKNLTC